MTGVNLNALYDNEHAAVAQIVAELRRAQTLYPAMRSPYEAVTIVWEEFDEWRQAVLHGTTEQAQHEAVQLAAMIVRAMIDGVNQAAPKH